MPLLAGIMPVREIAQLQRFRDLSGCVIPEDLAKFLSEGPDVLQRGVDYATQQCEELLRNGVPGLQLYCRNQHQSVVRITENLRGLGFLPRRV